MNIEHINTYCDPLTKQPLRFESGQLISETHPYPVIDGIPVFIQEEAISGLNKKYMHFYDRISFLYRVGAKLTQLFANHGIETLLGDLEISDHDRVLEVSVGTGDNLAYLHKKAPEADYWGLDISAGMLSQCRKNLKRWGFAAELAQGNGEILPYTDEQFDVVFHIGGINFFNDKQAAVAELIRVAKPGTRIVIIDETDRWVRNIYQKMPFVSNYYDEMDKADLTCAPVEFVPKEMRDVRLELLWKGGMYKLSFVKPE